MALSYFLGGAATIITFIQSISTTVLTSAINQNISNEIILTQTQFN